jgi:hypothetical protein
MEVSIHDLSFVTTHTVYSAMYLIFPLLQAAALLPSIFSPFYHLENYVKLRVAMKQTSKQAEIENNTCRLLFVNM